jgi:probable HAF family extracellular repeat protein
MLNPDGARGCCPESAYLYSDGTFTDLSDSKSASTAVNDRGEIVGSREGSPGGGFLYRHGQMNDLAALGCSGCAPNDISRNGKFVGTASLSNGDSQAFLWAKGVMRDLGTLGGSFHEKRGNRREPKGNDCCRQREDSRRRHHGWAYAHGEMVDLNALIGPSIGTVVDVQDVNDRGQIVGQIAVTDPDLRRGTFAVLLTPRRH